MATTSIGTINSILNQTAVEVGFDPVENPYGSTLTHFVQMRYLLQTAGEELCVVGYNWEFLKGSFSFVTVSATNPDGVYDLPSDFLFMLNQTGWDRTNRVPLIGPLSDQEWTYLEGRNLVTQTIYANFRFSIGKFEMFPSPPPDGLNITYEYQTKNWVQDASNPDVNKDAFSDGGDKPLFNKTLMSRLLKVKWLEAKGFDSTKAEDDLVQIYSALTGKDKGAQVVNAGGFRKYPFLDGIRNTPDTGYGA